MSNTIFWMLILSIFSTLFGIILWRKGAPYGMLMSTLHKIISFALGLIYILVIYVQLKMLGITIFPFVVAIFTLVSFIISVVSGSIMISSSTKNKVLIVTHSITTLLTYILGIFSLILVDII